MRKKFDGMYYKHQKDEHTIALIAGVSDNHAFVQVITTINSHYFKFPLSEYKIEKAVCYKYPSSTYKTVEIIKIGNNTFSENGIKLNIKDKDFSICGEINYFGLTPVKYDIMGPFKFFPMQCSHKVLSLHHKLVGSLTINDETIDFNDGIGYIEGDYGSSFPKSYAWVQCNDFSENACIMVSIADIPFAGLHFCGCICVVYLKGIEYRFATYLGVRILVCNKHKIVLKQRNLQLKIDIDKGKGHNLLAPERGKMTREISERITCGARFRFLKDNKTLFEQYSKNASFEYVE